jgi:hypothetical protein
MAKTRRPDGKPETPADKRFFDARESGYRGATDEHGRKLTPRQLTKREAQMRERARTSLSRMADQARRGQRWRSR